MTKCCGNCKYWNNDTGFCSIEMIPKLKSEICEFWNGDVGMVMIDESQLEVIE